MPGSLRRAALKDEQGDIPQPLPTTSLPLQARPHRPNHRLADLRLRVDVDDDAAVGFEVRQFELNVGIKVRRCSAFASDPIDEGAIAAELLVGDTKQEAAGITALSRDGIPCSQSSPCPPYRILPTGETKPVLELHESSERHDHHDCGEGPVELWLSQNSVKPIVKRAVQGGPDRRHYRTRLGLAHGLIFPFRIEGLSTKQGYDQILPQGSFFVSLFWGELCCDRPSPVSDEIL
jgi:hypothetical protein